MLAGFVAEWNPQKVDHARELRRIVRAAGRQARDLSVFLYPLASTASLAGQVVSFIPNIVKGLVTGVSSVVDVFGMAMTFVGGGLGYSASAVEKTGRSIQNLSAAMPTVVTGVLVAGLSLLFMFPNLQAWIVSGLASTGLMLASKMASGARTYVDDNSLWATLLETFELFALRAREDLQ
ncbi:uncharacterized protein LOC134778601 [Penaeus indicus]|uniref:uncharacterized protein LOC134778601 n=1 Tax=Penaeus indicus TaxID=29960 RepID=UPI00300CA61B